MTIADIDTEIGRLENIIRDGIEPRIPGLNIHPVRVDSSFVIVIYFSSCSHIKLNAITTITVRSRKVVVAAIIFVVVFVQCNHIC